MADPQARRRKQLLFRSTRRGTRESDTILGQFASQYVKGMDAVQLDRYEALLEQSDPDLLGWIMGTRTPPAEHDNDVLKLLIRFKSTLSEN